jgi:peptidoglycan hydrolase-like protein with peptidoglycan-binding domain
LSAPKGTTRMVAIVVGAVAALVALVLAAVAGWSSVGGTEPQPAAAVARQDPSTTEQSTTTTEPPPTTTTSTTQPAPPPPPPPGLGPGDKGEAVTALETKLTALKYDTGPVDGTYDKITGYAVMAFQKVTGMDRSGRATDDVIAAVNATEGTPPALVTGGPPHRVEVDIARQVLFLYEDGQVAKILPVSTGSNARFCSEGWCRKAVTPGGSFSVYRAGRGWEIGPLGGLYNPLYFNGGVAIHGAQSVPAGPASHGCVRIPMNAAEWFPSRVGVGTAVYVLGPGDQINVPPPAPAPGEPLPTGPAEPAEPEPTLPPEPPTTSLIDLLNPTTTTVP